MRAVLPVAEPAAVLAMWRYHPPWLKDGRGFDLRQLLLPGPPRGVRGLQPTFARSIPAVQMGLRCVRTAPRHSDGVAAVTGSV